MILVRSARSLGLSLACLGFLPTPLSAQQAQVSPPVAAPSPATPSQRGAFVAYEITEMSINGFRHFAGELGFRFGARHQVRVSIMEVDVSERDLAGWWSASVDGRGVEGYFRAYELNADRFFAGNWYVSGNAGYIANEFRHVTLPDRLKNETLTAGVGVGYSRSNLFGVKRLHLNVAMPVRIYFDGIEETRLGDATVRVHRIVPNTWIFIGYQF